VATTFVNGEDVSAKIRTESIAKNIGAVSDDPEIREYVNSLLRRWSENESIIMDGRDIGTVVFPSADLKIYLDASVDVRARRRFREYEDAGKNVDLNDIKNQIIQRDIEDQSRPVGALRRAEDAVYLDTSGMDRDEVIDAVCDLIAPLLEKANAC
jgi:cytidylate kinase